jgi:hypothetical protein
MKRDERKIALRCAVYTRVSTDSGWIRIGSGRRKIMLHRQCRPEPRAVRADFLVERRGFEPMFIAS